MQTIKRDYKQICMGDMRMQFNLSGGELVTVEKTKTHIETENGLEEFRLTIRIELGRAAGETSMYSVKYFEPWQIIYAVRKAKHRFKHSSRTSG